MHSPRYFLRADFPLLCLLGAICLIGPASLHAQVQPRIPLTAPGASGLSAATSGLVDAWQFSGTPSTVQDSVGSESLVQTASTVSPSSWPGTYDGNNLFLQPNSGYFATPGMPYNSPVQPPGSYELTSTSYQTFGDGNPHSLVLFFSINNYTYSASGSQFEGWTPLYKFGEYELQVNSSFGGSIDLLYGSTLQNTLSATAYPALANQFIGNTGANTNLSMGWYMATITYDGSSQLCIAINDAALNCVTGVAFTTSSSSLKVLGPVGVEAMFAFNTVLKGSNDPGSGCGGPASETPCTRDLLYNYVLQGQLIPGNETVLQVNGGACVSNLGWSASFTTYQSPSITQPVYDVYNPSATCAVTTNAPAITFNLVALNGQSNFPSQNAHIGVWVDGAFWGIVQAQQTGGQLVTETLPADGATHKVEFNAAGYVGYSGSNSAPFSGMYALVVNDVRVINTYTLTPVTPASVTGLLVNGDSIAIGDASNWLETDSIFQRMSSLNGGNVANVTLNAVGGDALWYHMGCNPGAAGASGTTCSSTVWANGSGSNTNATTPAAYANQLKTWYGCPSYFWQEMAVNDHNKSFWKAADAEMAMSYFWKQWNSICPTTLNYQQSPFYNKTAATTDVLGDYLVSYSQGGAALSPSWQADLAAACSAAQSCNNVNVTGTGASGTAANQAGFPVYGDATYGNCATIAGGPTAANDAYYSDGLHFTSCGYEMAYNAILATVGSWTSSNSAISTTTTASVSAGTVSYFSSVTLTATVATTRGAGQVAPLGITLFYQGSTSGQLLGQASTVPDCTYTGTRSTCVGTASLSVDGTALSPGSNSIVAYFAGDNFNDPASISNAVSVNVDNVPQSITFTNQTSVLYGASPLTLSATTSSGLAPGFSLISGPATIAGNTLTFTGAGSVVVKASQPGNSIYSAAASLQTITVNPAPLNVTPNNASSIYGSSPPGFTGAVLGLVNGDTLGASITVFYASTGTASSSVGSYPVTASVGGSSLNNYTITTNSGTLTISPASLTVKVNPGSFTYGGALPALSGSVSGLVNGDTSNLARAAVRAFVTRPLDSPPADIIVTYSTWIAANASVGAYPAAITATVSGPATGNYSVTVIPAALTIKPATLKVTASNASAIYGSALPAFSVTYLGFVNGDTPTSVLSGAPGLETTAVQGSPVGMYAITASQGSLAAANYIFSFVGGSLTVNRAPLTVTATAASKVYGSPVPLLTYAITGFVNRDTPAVLSGAPLETTTATPGASVGFYPINISVGSLTAGNYSFLFVTAELTIARAPLTVTPNPAAKTYGQPEPAFNYTISGLVNNDTANAYSGAPQLTTTATIHSATGTYPISAALGSLAAKNYSFSFVTNTLTITSATLTVTPANTSSVYGAALPRFSYSIAGYLNGDTSAVTTGAPVLNSAASVGSPAGAYPITANTGAMFATNYIFVAVAGTLTINAAALTVTPVNKTRPYGSPNPALTYIITGLVNNDTAAAYSGAPALSTSGGSASSVGTYPITAAIGSLSSANYTFTLNQATLTIAPAPLTVSPASATAAYGSTMPAPAYAITGFVNGDTSSVVTGSPSITVNAPPAPAVGSYSITAALGTLSTANYSFAFSSATLTIKPATLKVIAANASALYGSALPAFTASYSGFVNGDTALTALSGSPGLVTSAAPGSPVGMYPIATSRGSLAAANYIFVFSNGLLTINRAPLNVTANPASKVYGAALPALSYSVKGFVNGDTTAIISGSPRETTPATQGSQVGFYPISISVGTLTASNYAFTFSTSELAITKATLTVTPNPASKTYGQSEPDFTYTIAGLVNNDSASAYSGTPQLTTTATIHSPAGSYPIGSAPGSLTSKDYAFSYLASALTVTPAILTITPDNAASTYGSGPPAFGYKIGGYRNGDTSSVITGAPVLATIASAKSPVGSYSITANIGAMSASNYIFTAASGTLTINPAVLKVTAESGSVTQGKPIPRLTYTIIGFVNGDGKQVISGSPSLSTDATPSSPIGTYPISIAVGTLSAANYTFSLANGILKVTPP